MLRRLSLIYCALGEWIRLNTFLSGLWKWNISYVCASLKKWNAWKTGWILSCASECSPLYKFHIFFSFSPCVIFGCNVSFHFCHHVPGRLHHWTPLEPGLLSVTFHIYLKPMCQSIQWKQTIRSYSLLVIFLLLRDAVLSKQNFLSS